MVFVFVIVFVISFWYAVCFRYVFCFRYGFRFRLKIINLFSLVQVDGGEEVKSFLRFNCSLAVGAKLTHVWERQSCW